MQVHTHKSRCAPSRDAPFVALSTEGAKANLWRYNQMGNPDRKPPHKGDVPEGGGQGSSRSFHSVFWMIVTAWWQHVCPRLDHCVPRIIRPAPHVTEGRMLLSVLAVSIPWSTGHPTLKVRFHSVFPAHSNKNVFCNRNHTKTRSIELVTINFILIVNFWKVNN